MAEKLKHVYFAILATDVIGTDPGNGEMAWVKWTGAIEAVDANHLQRYFPVGWEPSFESATIIRSEMYARRLWEYTKRFTEQMEYSAETMNQVFGFVPAGLALVRYEGNGSWQMTTTLVDSYWFEETP